jgi:hypothetical protein
MDEFHKLYRILEVNETDSWDDIKRSYYRLAKQYHPDLNHNDHDATEKFINVNFAIEKLKTFHGVDEKKNRYMDHRFNVATELLGELSAFRGALRSKKTETAYKRLASSVALFLQKIAIELPPEELTPDYGPLIMESGTEGLCCKNQGIICTYLNRGLGSEKVWLQH